MLYISTLTYFYSFLKYFAYWANEFLLGRVILRALSSTQGFDKSLLKLTLVFMLNASDNLLCERKRESRCVWSSEENL